MFRFVAPLTVAVLISGAASAADTFGPAVGADEGLASQYGLYIALKAGGGPLVPDTDYTAPPTTARPTILSGAISYDEGWYGAMEVGYFLTPNIRAGVELAYGNLDPESFTGRAANNSFPPFSVTFASGDIDSYSAIAEAAYEFDNFGFFRPYVKVGAGIGYVSLDDVTPDPNNFFGFANDSDTVAVGRVGAGFAVPLSDHVDLLADYDFTFGQDAEFDFSLPGTGASAPFSVDVEAHRIGAGLRFRL